MTSSFVQVLPRVVTLHSHFWPLFGLLCGIQSIIALAAAVFSYKVFYSICQRISLSNRFATMLCHVARLLRQLAWLRRFAENRQAYLSRGVPTSLYLGSPNRGDRG